MRTDRIRLPAGAWHCSSDKCSRGSTCARRLAAIPPGGIVADGLHESPALLGGCLHHMREADARRLTQQQADEAKPAPKPAPKGIV